MNGLLSLPAEVLEQIILNSYFPNFYILFRLCLTCETCRRRLDTESFWKKIYQKYLTNRLDRVESSVNKEISTLIAETWDTIDRFNEEKKVIYALTFGYERYVCNYFEHEITDFECRALARQQFGRGLIITYHEKKISLPDIEYILDRM